MNIRREVCQDCGRDLKDVAPEQPKASATAEAKGGSQQQLGSVEWELEAIKPPSYSSVLVYGVLECEKSPDTHEGYWDGKKWQSVRRDDDISALRKLKLLNVTHWAHRPTPPNRYSAKPGFGLARGGLA